MAIQLQKCPSYCRQKVLDVDRKTENLSMARLAEKPVTLGDGGKWRRERGPHRGIWGSEFSRQLGLALCLMQGSFIKSNASIELPRK